MLGNSKLVVVAFWPVFHSVIFHWLLLSDPSSGMIHSLTTTQAVWLSGGKKMLIIGNNWSVEWGIKGTRLCQACVVAICFSLQSQQCCKAIYLIQAKNYNPANTSVIYTHPWQPVEEPADSSFM